MTLVGFLRVIEANLGRRGGLEESDPQVRGKFSPKIKILKLFTNSHFLHTLKL